MPRELARCGTSAAYRRHKRRGEAIDAACAAAARDQKNGRVEARRADTAEVVRLAIADAPPAPEQVDPLTEARDALRAVKAAMSAGAPGIAALSKERRELVALIARLEAAEKPKESRLDDLAARRAARIAGSAS